MIPILFDSSETAFTSNGIGRLTDCISCTVTEERNGIYECELQYPITGKWYSEMIENGGIIGVIHDDNHDIQPFDIYQSTAPIDGVVTFYAHHISYRLNNIILKPFSASTAADAVAAITTNSVNTNPFTFSTDKTTSATFELLHPASVRSILFGSEGSLLDTFGTAEFEFDKFNVQMLLNRGSDTGVTVRFGKNMTEMEWKIDDSGTFNAIAPYWTDGVVYVYPTDIIVNPTTAITPVKPVAMDMSDKFETQPTKQQLTRAAKAYLDDYSPWNKDDNIRINFIAMWQSPEYADVASIQRVGLCDTVSVYYTDMGLVAEKKQVVRVVFDVLTERFSEMELGSVSNSYVAIENSNEQSQSASSQSINHLSSALASCISGKKVSIIGDSISTFNLDGYMTEGYAQYYPNSDVADVTSVDQTWWKRVIDASGCTLEANASYSGSRVTNTHSTAPSFYDRCTTTILGDPETILVELGTNDSNNSVTIGSTDFETTYTSLSEATFATAYIKGIKALQALYPYAQIVCVILNMSTSYARTIQRIATALGCRYVINNSYEKGSGSHPNAHGMRQIASSVLALQDWNDGTANPMQRVSPEILIENGNLIFDDEDFRRGTTPSSDYSGQYISFRDNSDTNCTYVRNFYTTDKVLKLRLAATHGTANYLDIGSDYKGNCTIDLSHPAVWRKALGLTYETGDTFWISSKWTGIYGHVTSSTKQLQCYLIMPKSLENISSVTVNTCTGVVRGISGYLDSLSSDTDFNDGTTYTATASVYGENMIRLVIQKSSAWTNATNNTPIVLAVYNLKLTFA